ncbi:hypothetical protein [Cupriavidus sp. 8B]
MTKQYAVYTPPMHEMIKQVGDWIEQQRPGGYVYGASRLGKTRCVQWYVAKVLEERFNAAVPLVVWNRWNRRPDSQTSEAGFWHQILLASRFEFAHPKQARALSPFSSANRARNESLDSYGLRFPGHQLTDG